MADNLSFLENIKVQLELLLPILNRLRNKYGKNEIDEIVFEEIDAYLKSKYTDKASMIEGSDKDKWQILNTELLEQVGSDVELEFVDMTENKIKLFANSCKIAEFFKSIGEVELGYHIACKVDHHIADVCENGVQFSREGTIMIEGGKCDYLYEFKSI